MSHVEGVVHMKTSQMHFVIPVEVTFRKHLFQVLPEKINFGVLYSHTHSYTITLYATNQAARPIKVSEVRVS